MTYTLDSARLNRRITIQRRSTAVDAFGQQTTAWTDFLTCWASIEPMSGRELVAAQAVQSEVTHTLTIRYRPTVTAAMRALYQGRIFEIRAVQDPETAHVALAMMCTEGVSPG